MQGILQKIQVHVPFYLLREKLLPWAIREGINPEIAFGHYDLDRFQAADFRETAERLADAGLLATLHAPFMDLRPGALDPRIRQTSLDRLRRVFDLIPWFKPRSVVCHASFDEKYYVSAEALWLENSLATWRTLLGCIRGTGTIIALENVYERDPRLLKRLLDELASPQVRFCLDTGHANVFGGVPLGLWIEALGDLLGEIHIHDNHGTADEHLPVGEGNVPFRELFAMVRGRNLKPILTVESHSEKGLRRMLENLQAMELPERS
ncbi:MAG: sugar phosphate isomerase/epimerase [Deltaproteobacteria bacterium]|jgi:sugar phosphate isomerase/epimerase|nr:sugar phosphate isomerase/epimerase [Deltaproteobacteria bacterium]